MPGAPDGRVEPFLLREVPQAPDGGDAVGGGARRVAEANGWPLLAEPSSGARGGPSAVPAYRLLLGEPALGGAVRRVVVLGSSEGRRSSPARPTGEEEEDPT